MKSVLSISRTVAAAILFTIVSAGAALGAEEPLRVAGIQLEVSVDLYRNADTFRSRAAELIEEALENGPLDLVVFPEYCGVFFAFFDLPLGGTEITTLEEGAAYLRSRRGFEDLHDYFLSRQGRERMDRIWGPLARRYGTSILAGSYFAVEETGNGRELRNRALIYGPDGTVDYSQDKVYLTPFEQDVVGISPGKLEDAAPFEVDGRLVALTLCRDTFFESWERRFAGADLWIDIKANGQLYRQQQRALFSRALPERIGASEVEYGMTVCLNGEFLDLVWEGPSSTVRSAPGGGTLFLSRAETVRGTEILLLEVPD